jgi:Zn-dependent M28 family amino/carboxypeptidase
LLSGVDNDDSLPTVAIVAHYDASGAAPTLSFGADSNGSGVTILLELARIWGHLYRSSKSRPKFNMVFLLAGGGKINFLGTKRWLDEQREDQV